MVGDKNELEQALESLKTMTATVNKMLETLGQKPQAEATAQKTQVQGDVVTMESIKVGMSREEASKIAGAIVRALRQQ